MNEMARKSSSREILNYLSSHSTEHPQKLPWKTRLTLNLLYSLHKTPISNFSDITKSSFEAETR